MHTVDIIIAFLQQQTGCTIIQPHDDINRDLGVTGDDWFELIDEYAKKFNVDCSMVLWYYHTKDEASVTLSPGNLFFKSPSKQATHIPVTADMLTEFANDGVWGIQYPLQELKKARYNIDFKQIIIFLLFLAVIYSILK